MIELIRYVSRRPKEVWRALTDPRTWEVQLVGFEPVVANKFVLKHYPPLMTRYTGESQCEVTAVAPGKLLELSLVLRARSMPRTEWKLRFEVDAYLDGSRIKINFLDVDESQRDQRIQLYVMIGFLNVQLSRLCGSREVKKKRWGRRAVAPLRPLWGQVH